MMMVDVVLVNEMAIATMIKFDYNIGAHCNVAIVDLRKIVLFNFVVVVGENNCAKYTNCILHTQTDSSVRYVEKLTQMQKQQRAKNVKSNFAYLQSVLRVAVALPPHTVQ